MVTDELSEKRSVTLCMRYGRVLAVVELLCRIRCSPSDTSPLRDVDAGTYSKTQAYAMSWSV